MTTKEQRESLREAANRQSLEIATGVANVLMDVAKLETDLANAHCLLQSAYAAVDADVFPEVAQALSEALECGLPQCSHVSELTEALVKAEADRALLLAALKEVAKMPCLTELLGDEMPECGCASCQAKAAIAVAEQQEEGSNGK